MQRMKIQWAVLGLLVSAASAASAADYRLEKRLPLAAGGTISVRSEVGGVKITGGDGSEAAAVVTSDRADFAETYTVRFEAPRPDRVELVVERKVRGVAGWFGGWSGRTQIEVTVPRSAGADVVSSGGGITVTHLGGTVAAESSGGGVHVANLGGAAKLSSSGGAIEAEQVAGDLEASSSGGGVQIREAHGAVVAKSSGGAVSAIFAAGNAHGGRLHSSGGGVSARIDPHVALEIDASSSGGSVDCDLPLTTRGRVGRDDVHGTLNGGGALLELTSSGGGISIDAR
jgi:hypothetical protein